MNWQASMLSLSGWKVLRPRCNQMRVSVCRVPSASNLRRQRLSDNPIRCNGAGVVKQSFDPCRPLIGANHRRDGSNCSDAHP